MPNPCNCRRFGKQKVHEHANTRFFGTVVPFCNARVTRKRRHDQSTCRILVTVDKLDSKLYSRTAFSAWERPNTRNCRRLHVKSAESHEASFENGLPPKPPERLKVRNCRRLRAAPFRRPRFLRCFRRFAPKPPRLLTPLLALL